nr:MAG TPA: Splicing factor 3B subunit 3 complex, splicing modulator, SPLICING [Caudoviricetes sp.]
MLLYFSVANGEPPIGIQWETFQKFAKNTYSFMK